MRGFLTRLRYSLIRRLTQSEYNQLLEDYFKIRDLFMACGTLLQNDNLNEEQKARSLENYEHAQKLLKISEYQLRGAHKMYGYLEINYVE